MEHLKRFGKLALGPIAAFASCVAILTVNDEAAALEQPLPCQSFQGMPVPYIANYQLPNVGVATFYQGRPVIIMNPGVLQNFSPLVQQWWFAQECGHHALPPHQNSEVNADCFAARALRDLGYIQDWQSLQQVMYELSGLPGNAFTGHLPGPERAQQVRNCVFS